MMIGRGCICIFIIFDCICICNILSIYIYLYILRSFICSRMYVNTYMWSIFIIIYIYGFSFDFMKIRLLKRGI